MKKRVHFILQGKGGVGKSVIAAFLAQYLLENKQKILCIDTDPVNKTFAGYQELNVKAINILEGDEINVRNFDVLVQNILDSTHDVIIDNGASSFVPLSNYVISNEIIEYLDEENCQALIHIVITGGQAMMDTLMGFNNLLRQFPARAVKFVVWINPYWGIVENEGKSFTYMRAYLENRSRILGVVNLPNLKAETFGRDLSDLLQSRRTFDQGIDDHSLTRMARRRLGMIKNSIFAEIDKLNLIGINNIDNSIDDIEQEFTYLEA